MNAICGSLLNSFASLDNPPQFGYIDRLQKLPINTDKVRSPSDGID